MKQDTLYCNICGAKIKGGESTASKMWCSRCYGERRNALDRIYTRDTVYLVCKWHAEGMSVKDIAILLGRSEENIQQALDIGSKNPNIAAKYMQYLIPKPQKYYKCQPTEKSKPPKQYKPPKLYSVYDKINKRYIIQGATTSECAKAMGITDQAFYYQKRISEIHSERSPWFIHRTEDINAKQGI